MRAFRGRTRLLAEDSKVAGCLLTLLDEGACAGKQVHDANVEATMLVYGIDTVVTVNPGDSARFARHIRLIGLSSPPP